MADGRSLTGMARQLWITEGAVEKHVHSILTKPARPATDDDHRRVLAVVTSPEPPDIVADQGLDSVGWQRRLSVSVIPAFRSPMGA
jgi:hypothetical protein